MCKEDDQSDKSKHAHDIFFYFERANFIWMKLMLLLSQTTKEGVFPLINGYIKKESQMYTYF